MQAFMNKFQLLFFALSLCFTFSPSNKGKQCIAVYFYFPLYQETRNWSVDHNSSYVLLSILAFYMNGTENLILP